MGNLFLRRIYQFRAQQMLPAMVLVLSLLVSGCKQIGEVPTFQLSTATAWNSDSRSYRWTGLETIDGGDFKTNNDQSTSCNDGANGLINTTNDNSGTAVTRGCMQQPAAGFFDSRWMIGFPQNYLGNSNGGLEGFSALANMTALLTNPESSYFTGDFGAFGVTLGVIDPGGGLNAVPTGSSRYIDFAELTTGDVVAVYFVDTTASTDRDIYASVYNSTTDSWEPATQLHDANGVGTATDFAVDYVNDVGSVRARLCRPKVAASENGSAMAVWCADNATQGATVYYSIYTDGIGWSAAAQLATNQDLVFPGFHSITYRLTATTANLTNADLYWAQFQENGNTYTARIRPSLTLTQKFAIATAPSTDLNKYGIFRVDVDSTNAVKACSTLKNFANATLGTPVILDLGGTNTQTTFTLSQMGVSILLDPTCSDTDNTTWNFTMSYNRSLKPKLRDLSVATDRVISLLDDQTNAGVFEDDNLGDNDFDGAAADAYDNNTTNNHDLTMTGAVDVGADIYGNFAVIRTLVHPLFLTDVIDNTSANYARRLVGHQYIAGTGFVTTGDDDPYATNPLTAFTPATHEGYLHTQFISNPPACLDALSSSSPNYTKCSVKNPKIMVSESGKGLILFHQNQLKNKPSTALDFPNRLWFATYSTSSGFSSTASKLDTDQICNTSSIANDVAVCETGSYSDSALDQCQFRNDTDMATFPYASDAATLGTPTGISHDIPPIAADMNSSGQAVVAYHKYENEGTASAPSCTYLGTWVAIYDPFNGFGDVERIDEEDGNTMHANVDINENGDIAVIWETYASSSAKYVYLKTYTNGEWNDAEKVSENFSNSAESTMPVARINEGGEIFVSFTYGESGGTRRQYAKKYTYY